MAQGNHAVVRRPYRGVLEIGDGHRQVGAAALDAGLALVDQRQGFLDHGAGEFDLAHGGDGFLLEIVETGLRECRRGAQTVQPREGLAGLGKPRVGAGDAGLGHGVAGFGVDLAGLAFMGFGGGNVAAPGRPRGVDHGDHIAAPHPVAYLDAQLGDRAGNARRHSAALARHQAADHREGLSQRLAYDRVDLNQGRLALRPGDRRQREAGDYRQGEDEISRGHHARTIYRGVADDQ